MDHRRELADLGFTALEDYMGPTLLSEMRARVDELLAQEGAAAGSEFKTEENARRLANLVDKGEVFREAISRPEMLDLVESVLGDGFKLSSLNMRSANPHSASVQPFHVDMGLLPDAKGYAVCNCVWMLDDFTLENGALRVVPGSHNWHQKPQEEMADPYAAASSGVAGDGQGGNRGGDERPHLARRHCQSNGQRTAGAAQLFLPS